MGAVIQCKPHESLLEAHSKILARIPLGREHPRPLLRFILYPRSQNIAQCVLGHLHTPTYHGTLRYPCIAMVCPIVVHKDFPRSGPCLRGIPCLLELRHPIMDPLSRVLVEWHERERLYDPIRKSIHVDHICTYGCKHIDYNLYHAAYVLCTVYVLNC